VDFGALMRPWRWISLGAAVLDADRPGPLPRRWVLSTALRPWRENLDIAADLRWAECTNVQSVSPSGFPIPNCGFSRKDLIFTGRARVSRGLTVLGQVALLDRSRTQGMVGLQIDLDHVGGSYAPVIGPGDPGDAWRIRASTERWPSVRNPLRQAVEIDLKKALSHPRPGPLALLFGTTARDPLSETLAALRRMARDPSTKAIVFRTGGMALGLARAEELRAGIEDLRGSGKKVLFYLESGGDL